MFIKKIKFINNKANFYNRKLTNNFTKKVKYFKKSKVMQ